MTRWGSVLLVLIPGCGPAPGPSVAPPAAKTVVAADESLIGVPVDDAIARLGLTLDEHPVIEEPPGIGRGVQGKNAKGEEVWLYVNRNEVGFTDQGVQGKLPLIRTLKVAGVARKTAAGWVTAGQVIFYYHQR